MLNMKIAAAGLMSAFRDMLCQSSGQGSSQWSKVHGSSTQGSSLIPMGQYEWKLSLCSVSLSPPNYGVLVRAVQKAVSQQAGTLLLREQNLALTAHSARAQQSFPRHAQPWPVTQGPRSGDDEINIVSIDCLNSDIMFSFSVFLGLFLSPSCQTSSCGRLLEGDTARVRVLEKVVCLLFLGVPSQDPHRPLQEKRSRTCTAATTCKEKLPALRCKYCKFRI